MKRIWLVCSVLWTGFWLLVALIFGVPLSTFDDPLTLAWVFAPWIAGGAVMGVWHLTGGHSHAIRRY